MRETVRRIGAAAVCAVWALTAGWAAAGPAGAEPQPAPPPSPGFVPGPTDWTPHQDFWPYNTFTYQLTPEMVSGMADACQWFGARFDPLMGRINDFNRNLGDQHDVYAAPGVQQQANAVVADIDRETAFLVPRIKPLTIRNTPDNYGPYSPIYGGEQMTSVAFQLTRIAESIRKRDPSGVTHANIVAATGWGNALRQSGACT